MRLIINRIIKYLILSDLVFWSGWGLFNPVFAIFVIEKIEGGDAFVVGAAVAIYWIVKALLRTPIGIFLDSLSGERDDYFFLVLGLFVVALIPFGYYFSSQPWHIYLLQAVHGVAMAVSLSGWYSIFTRHIDKGKEGVEWGIQATTYGLGIGISGLIGGWAVTKFGFEPVLILVGIMGLIGVLILLGLRNEIKGVFDNGFNINLKEIFKREERQ
jgi:MFS family permease